MQAYLFSHHLNAFPCLLSIYLWSFDLSVSIAYTITGFLGKFLGSDLCSSFGGKWPVWPFWSSESTSSGTLFCLFSAVSFFFYNNSAIYFKINSSFFNPTIWVVATTNSFKFGARTKTGTNNECARYRTIKRILYGWFDRPNLPPWRAYQKRTAHAISITDQWEWSKGITWLHYSSPSLWQTHWNGIICPCHDSGMTHTNLLIVHDYS